MYFLTRPASTDASHISRVAPHALAELLASQATVPSTTIEEPTFFVDVLRTTNAIVVEAELRGISKEDISVQFDSGVLRIEALRRRANVVHEVKPLEQSQARGALSSREKSFPVASGRRAVAAPTTRVRTSASNRTIEHLCRTLIMPASINAQGITAVMDDGILTITLAYLATVSRAHSNAN